MNVPTTIRDSRYKDRDAVTIESDMLAVQFMPELGAKMVSLVCRKTGREFLAQAAGAEYKVLEYDGDYVESECSGFDDMFPTIDRVFYDSYPWKGVEIPDHGEICGLPWDCERGSDSLHMSVHGVRFPYRLEKRIEFETPNVLKIDYRAVNLSEFDMDFLWAAHPMINAEEGGEILVPYENGAAVTCGFSWDEGLAGYGDAMTWPQARGRDGKARALNVTPARDEEGNNYKFFFDHKMPDGWCAYRYPDGGPLLRLSFPADKVPYLCVWVNEGSFHGLHNVAMEPCTGSYDRPDLAKQHRQNSVLKARDEYSWYLKFHLEVP